MLKYRHFQICKSFNRASKREKGKNRLIMRTLLLVPNLQEKEDLFFMNYIPYFAA